MKYETIVGLEIHVELSTKSKMFCRCELSTLSDKPNSNTCPVCLGLPGALPFTNQSAIENCIKIALALGCTINTDSFFERKNYFYPDLSKGFQTSQFLHPFGKNGKLEIEINGQKKSIGITRVHMEEDTGKLTHANVNGNEVSLIDFNRSGVPLVEIVTEPDIRSGEEAKEFLTKLQRIIKYLNVSDADMEKGHMRLEPNISLRKVGEASLPNYKVEVKNINSFRFVEKAIEYEEKRHKELLDKKETPIQETRGWNEFKSKTISQRSKEEAHDYRYFPEPDIPPIKLSNEQIEKIKSEIPELQDDKIKRFTNKYQIKKYDAEILTRKIELANYFEEVIEIGREHDISAQKIASHIINKKPKIKDILPASLLRQIITESTVKQIDDKLLEDTIKKVREENPQAVTDYQSGKIQVIGFLIGMVKRKLPEAKDTEQIRKKLTEMLQ